MGVLLLTCLSPVLLAAPFPQETPPGNSKEVVGIVTDASNPDQIILGGAISVPVNSKTAYWIQSGNNKRKKASSNDVVVGAQIRAALGKDGVATKVTIVRGP